jgi:hypothetical protein
VGFWDGSQILVEEDENEMNDEGEELEVEKTIDLEVEGEVMTESRSL